MDKSEILDLRTAPVRPDEADGAHGVTRPTSEMKMPPEITRFRLAASIPNPDDGTSLMRGLGPLHAMAREDRRLEIVLPPAVPGGWNLSWSWLAGCDGLFLQRPFEPHEGRAAVMARMMGLPVWLDWDDDLLTVPIYNPKQYLYDPKQVAPQLERLVRLADVITCSTAEVLRRRLAPDGAHGVTRPTSEVIPNACMWPLSEGARERRVIWRGGSSHDADLLDVLPLLVGEAKRPQNGLWKWFFLGDAPWQVPDQMPHANLEMDQGADPFLFMGIMRHAAAFVQIVPLRDNAFNRCRSNLAWLEATASGAVVIAPDWEEWHRPGIINYSNNEGLARALRGVMESYALGESKAAGRPEHSNVQMSRVYIEKQLLLSQVNEARWRIINQMIRKNDEFRMTKAK